VSGKVLVIGGAGYIGGELCDQLVAQGYDVTVFDNLIYESRFLKDIPFLFGDIRDTQALTKIHEAYDSIVWLAALVGDGACAQDPELTFEINYHAVNRFLEATKRRIVFPSTCSVYGAQEGVLTEASEPKPLSAYAQTKLLAERAVLEHGGLAFRLGTLFGLGDRFSRLRLDLVVNLLTYKALHDRKITLFGGDQWRPIIAVRDVASYLAEAINHRENDVYNLGLMNVQIRDLAPIFVRAFPDLRVELVASKFEDLRNYRVSTDKALSTFAFRPQTSVESEVLGMLAVLRDKRIKNPLDPIYYNTRAVEAELTALRNYL
jgi:nucleoside-diphosphate-sugar epimerase